MRCRECDKIRIMGNERYGICGFNKLIDLEVGAFDNYKCSHSLDRAITKERKWYLKDWKTSKYGNEYKIMKHGRITIYKRNNNFKKVYFTMKRLGKEDFSFSREYEGEGIERIKELALQEYFRTDFHELYCAGKIDNWRKGLGTGLSLEIYLNNRFNKIMGNIIYGGPFFISCDHGCFHGINSHGVGSDRSGDNFIDGNNVVESGVDGMIVNDICHDCIDRSEIIYAWIGELDCYGTIEEIGYAKGRGKTIILGIKEGIDLSDIWFVRESGDIVIEGSDPLEVLRRGIGMIRGEY